MFQKIKQTISSRQIADYYGLKTDRKGFTKCLFHNEKSASLKLYDGSKGFSCFGCNQTGDSVDLVMKLFNIDKWQAVVRISNDFSLNITTKKLTNREKKELEHKKALLKSAENKRKRQNKSHDLAFREIYFRFHELKNTVNDDFWDALKKLNKMESEYFGT